MSYELLKGIFFVFSIFLFIRIIAVYAKMFLEFMFNQKCKWYDKEVEKPRLLLNIIAFIALLLAFIVLSFKKGEIGLNFYDIGSVFASILLFCLCVLCVLFSWSDKFTNKPILEAEEKRNENDSLPKRNENDSLPKIKEGLDVKKICDDVINKKGYIEEKSRGDFILLLQRKEPKNKIIWKLTANNGKSQYKAELFGLLDEVFEEKINNSKYTRRKYADFICLNFKCDKEDFIADSVEKRLSEWITQQNNPSEVRKSPFPH